MWICIHLNLYIHHMPIICNLTFRMKAVIKNLKTSETFHKPILSEVLSNSRQTSRFTINPEMGYNRLWNVNRSVLQPTVNVLPVLKRVLHIGPAVLNEQCRLFLVMHPKLLPFSVFHYKFLLRMIKGFLLMTLCSQQPSGLFMVVQVQVDAGVKCDRFTELPVSLVLFSLICVDIVEKIRPLRLTGQGTR